MPKRQVIGVVTSDRMAKTRRVEIRRKTRHPLYGKFVASRTICYVHDEENQSHEGDTVEIIESRPMSKLKRWQLVRIVQKSTTVDVAMLKAARKAEMDAEKEFLEQRERPAQKSHDDEAEEDSK
jgi:small subunit ribosomal protein S17